MAKFPPNEDLHQYLGRVFIGGGSGTPFFFAETRAWWGDGPKLGENARIVENVAGIRALGLEGSGRFPSMLRVHPSRPKSTHKFPARWLHLRLDGVTIKADLLTEKEPADLVVTPVEPWNPKPAKENIAVPAFRLAEGRFAVNLGIASQEGGSALRKAFSIALGAPGSAEGTIFGGVRFKPQGTGGNRTLPAVLVPGGIEFCGEIPDPTRDFGGEPLIRGRFRLERHVAATAPYALRLVGAAGGGGDTGLDALEGRIAGILGGLGAANAPAQIRFDRRPQVPPLVWPLKLDKGALSLVEIDRNSADYRMEIDPSAIDVRVQTNSRFPGDRPALARMNAPRLRLLRAGKDGFKVEAISGKVDELDKKKIAIDFKEGKEGWATALSGAIDGMQVVIPLEAHLDRLLGIYKAAGALPEDAARAPCVFIPVEGGWLQLAVPASQAGKAGAVPGAVPESPSALTGRVVVSHGEGARVRSIAVTQAAGLRLTVEWSPGDDGLRPRSATLEAWQPEARFGGFLFAAETSPTGEEALPTLKAGGAATRDLAIAHPRAGSGIEAAFSWTPAKDAKDEEREDSWSLEISGVVAEGASAADAEAHPGPHLAWLPPAGNPFITSYPLTRGLPSSAEPSLSRGLVPWKIEIAGEKTLRLEKDDRKTDMPRLGGTLTWALARPDGKLPGDGKFQPNTLVLPTLAGVEFLPGKTYGAAPLAALRYDLPVLDELFAWSDPPPPEDANRPAAASSGEDGAGERAPTAIEFDRLREVWVRNRARMALTRTKAAFATGWLKTGAEHTVTIDNLVEPLHWTPTFKVEFKDAWGNFELDKKPYRLDSALKGLSATFDIEKNTPVTIEGFAANLYERAGLLWDTRGFGMKWRAGRLKYAVVREVGANAAPSAITHLLTTNAATPIEIVGDAGFAGTMPIFHVRDLPVVRNEDGFAFDGRSNPVEAGAGSAFDRDGLPASLHEWRFFERPTGGKGDGPGQFFIRYEPFSFTPLRLAKASFDSEGKPVLLHVIGRMGLAPQDADAGEAGRPFGAEDVYCRGDLFRLELEPPQKGSDQWKAGWKGVRYQEGRIEDRGDTMLRVDVLLKDQSAGHRPVPARIGFDVAGYGGGGKMTATLSARLFGLDWQLEMSAERKKDALVLTESKAATPGQAEEIAIVPARPVVTLPLAAGTPALAYELAFRVIAGKDETTALAEIVMDAGSTRLTWLDLDPIVLSSKKPATGKKEHGPVLTVDHDTGRVAAFIPHAKAAPGAAPLFGLCGAKDGLDLRALAVAFTKPEKKESEKEAKNSLSPLAVSTAYVRIDASGRDGAGQSVEHTLFKRGGSRATEHAIRIGCTHEIESLIRWPTGGIVETDPASPSSRVIEIKPDTLLTHKVALHFNRHEISAGDLSRQAGKGPLVPRGAPIRLAVPARHRLSADAGRELAWRSLDTVTITTPKLWVEHADQLSFAPRYLEGVYRAGRFSESGQQDGILKLRHAASGLHDDYLVSSIATVKTDAVILAGGAVTHFSTGGGARAFVTTVSWIDSAARAALGLSEGALLQSGGGRWKVAIADLWAGRALQQAGALKSVPLKMAAQEREIGELLGRAGLPPAGGREGGAPFLPVEQAFFEKAEDKEEKEGNDKKGKDVDLTAAPFFIRAMLALDALWRDETAAAAGALAAGTLVAALPQAGPVVRLVPGEEKEPGTSEEAAATMFPADLVVLSRAAGSTISNYRMISGVDADAGFDFESAEIRDRALLEDRRAGAAIRIARTGEGEVRLHHVAIETRGLDFLSVPASPLIGDGTDLGVSAALGWPMQEGLEEAGRLSAALGDAFPVQSDESGFAARFQTYGWPAFAAGGNGAYYISFASHVVYDRTGAPEFNGPPARHLLVSPVRRRVPAPAGAGRKAHAAILPPAVTRTTIGRRPGVFEVSTAAITVAGVARDFDPARAHLGRPAISAPVTAAQLRNPRAPALPADTIAEDLPLDERVLRLRRRTYLSLGDVIPDGQRRQLAPFGEFSGDADVFRLQENAEAAQWRIAVRMAGNPDFGPGWSGEFVVEIDGMSSEWAGSPPRDMGTQLDSLLFDEKNMPSARLEIAGRVFDGLPFTLLNRGSGSQTRNISIIADSGASLRDIRDTLAEADADTAMRLVIDFNPSTPDSGLPIKRWNSATATIPLRLSPGERRVMAVAARTVAFGDPSYDRQLASLAMQDFGRIGDRQYVLAADRREYAAGSMLFLAAGQVGGDGGFAAGGPSGFTLHLRRLPVPDGTGEAGSPVDLVVDTVRHEEGSYPIACGQVYQVPLSRLVAREAGLRRTPALLPGEQLEISGTFDGNKDAAFAIRVRITAADVIAPAPSVFTVMEEGKDGKSAAVLLHASGPLPQRIEFPDLAGDLARGHVRRKALFVWRHARPENPDEGGRLHLVKIDRSGGAQLPQTDEADKRIV